MRFSLIALWMAFLGTSAGAQGKKEPAYRPIDDPEVQAQIRGILAAKNPGQLKYRKDGGASFRSLFELVGPEGVRKLRASENDSIAIQAAWEEVAQRIPDGETTGTLQIDKQKLNGFIGFLEGRSRVSAPDWWKGIVLNTRGWRHNGFVGTQSRSEEPDFYHNLDRAFSRAPIGTTVTEDGPRLVLRVGDASIRIPDTFRKASENLVVLFTPLRCYVVVHPDNTDRPYRFNCFERLSGKNAWNTEVWGTWWRPAGIDLISTGPPSHMWVKIVEEQNRVMVFGYDSVYFHAEAFRVQDGTNLFRFSTLY